MATPYKYYVIDQTDLENGALDARYYTRNQITTLLNGYVGKITGKSLVSDSEITKLAGIEAGAEVNNLSDAQVLDLTDGNETTLHKHNATNTPFTPTGNLSSTNVQTALVELDTEKASKLFATNLVTNGDFSNGTTGWTNIGLAAFTVASNEATILSNSQYDTLKFAFPIFSINDIIYVRASLKSTSNLVKFYLRQGASPYDTAFTFTNTGSGNYIVASGIGKIANITSPYGVEVRDERTSGFDNIYVKDVHTLNLTKIFGTGNEPTKEQMDWIFTERDRLGLGHLNGTAELLPMVSLLNLINKKANIAQKAWITPTLSNGWQDTLFYPTCQFMKDEIGFVHLKGFVQNGTASSFIFTLPIGYRVNQNTHLVALANDSFAYCVIYPSGNVIIFSNSNIGVSLNGITFKAEA